MQRDLSGRRRFLIAAATIGLIPIAAPIPAQAAAPASATVTVQKVTSGDSVRSTAAAPCLINQYALTRQTACSFEGTFELQLIAEDNTVIASLRFQVMSEVTVSGLNGRWRHVLSLIAGQANGNMSGTDAFGAAHCDQNCSGGGLHGQSGFDSGSIITWQQEFSSTYHGNAAWGSRSGWDIYFVNQRAFRPVSNTITINPPPSHRCDDLLSGLPWGCTYPQVTPVLPITGSTPTYHRHVGLAMNAGIPRTLTRTTSAFRVNQNTSTACPGPDAAHPWPPNFICEAYPLHATYEAAQGTGYGWLIIGGIGGGGPTFNCQVRWLTPRRGQTGGYSVCMIPLAEFSQAASAQNTFYFYNRVIDGDRFTVALT